MAGALTPRASMAVRDRRGRASEGVVVQASVLARLLGIRLLRLEAIVVLAPADQAPPSAPRVVAGRTSARPPGLPPRRPGVAGRGLADAVRSIDEGAELLAQARRNGASAG